MKKKYTRIPFIPNHHNISSSNNLFTYLSAYYLKFNFMKKALLRLLVLLLVFVNTDVFAQPSVLYTSLTSTTPSPSNSRFTLSTVGGFRQARFQANQTVSSGGSTWAFHTGSTGSPNYNPCWRPSLSSQLLSANTFIPTSFNNGALYQATSGGNDGQLPAITSGNYYTFNVSANGGSSNVMSLLETGFNFRIIEVGSSPNFLGGVPLAGFAKRNLDLSISPKISLSIIGL